MPVRRLACFVALLTLIASPAFAQFWDSLLGSKVDIDVEHPASLPLKVSTVALAEPEGRCAESILGRIEAAFVQNGLTVVDRRHLQRVLREHKLQVSGLVDEKTAASVGRLLGAQALIFLKVLHCGHDNSTAHYTDKENKTVYKYVTTGLIRGSLRTVDLTTGRVLAAQTLEETRSLESRDGYPDRDQILGKVEQSIALSVHKMFLPWQEKRTVVFYSEKECNLKAAFQLLRAKDLDGALHQSESNLAACRESAAVKPKTLGHAYYNLGLMQFLRKDHDAAIASLSEAAKFQDGDIVTNLLAESRSAQRLAAPTSRRDTQLPAIPSSTQPSRASTASNVRDQQMATQDTSQSIEERLQQLDRLKKKTLITPEEYARKRAEILEGI